MGERALKHLGKKLILKFLLISYSGTLFCCVQKTAAGHTIELFTDS